MNAHRRTRLASLSLCFAAGAALSLAVRGLSAASTIDGTTWFPAGPAPVTQGQAYRASSSDQNDARIDISGRTGPIAINPQNPQEIYLGTANGGVWHTTNGGQNWRPMSDDQESLAIGALALDGCAASGCNAVYAGTGEAAIRRDTYRGAGLLIGSVSGEVPTFSWTQSGGDLFRNGSINNIVLDPTKRILITLSSGETASASESTVTAPAPPQGYGIYRSGAAGWQKLAVAGSGSARPTSLVIDPLDGTLFAGFMGLGVFKSSTGGDTWCPLNPGVTAPGCTSAPGLPNTGTSFDFVQIAIRHPSAAQPAVLYASFGSCGDPITADCQPGIYRSNDGGATWAQTLPAVPGNSGILGGCPRAYSRYTHVLAIDPGTPEHLYLGGLELCLSIDGGHTFNQVGTYQLHPDQHGLAFDPSQPANMYSANDGGLYFSPDGGTTWQSRNDDLQITEFQSMSSSPLTARVIGGSQDNGTQMWLGSRIWQHIDDGDSASTVMDIGNANRMYDVYARQCPRGGSGALFSFQDLFDGPFVGSGHGLGGVNYDECYFSFTYPEDSAFYPRIAQDPQAPHALYIGTVKLYRSTNMGQHWDPVSPSLAGGGGPFPDIGTGNVITAIAVAKSNQNIVYVGLYDGSIWVSDASGPCTAAACWHQINSGTPANPVSWIAVHPNDANTAYVAFSGFVAGPHLFKTTSAGAPWTPPAGGLPADRPINTIGIEVNDTQRIWVGTDAGIYKSFDGGMTFISFSAGLPNVPVYEITLDELRGRAWAGTHGRGAFVLTRPAVSNFEGWVDGGMWDIPVYGTGFLSNQSCTMQILRQDGTTCAQGPVDADNGTIKTDDMGTLVTDSNFNQYQGKPVAWACLNGTCLGSTPIANCNLPGNPITTVIVNCGGSVGIDHVLGCQQQANPPAGVLGLNGTPAPPGGAAPLGAPALGTGPQGAPPPAGAPQRAFFFLPAVQAGDGSTRSLCSVRVPFTVGEAPGSVAERARDLVNASATCAASGVTAAVTSNLRRVERGVEDLPANAPHLLLAAPAVRGSQLMPAVQSDPGQATGLCFDLQGLGVATSDQLEITRVRFATGPSGAAGGALRVSEASGVGTCEIDVPTTPGQSAGQVAAAVSAAFLTPGIPYPRCPARHNPRDVARDGDSILTVLPHAVRVCVGDAGIGVAIQPDELKSRYPVANAGGDREVAATTVALDGSASTDPDSTPATADGIVLYQWLEVRPDGTTLLLGTGRQLTVTLAAGFHHVVLKVTNKAVLSDTAVAVIEVEPQSSFGQSPWLLSLTGGGGWPTGPTRHAFDPGFDLALLLEHTFTSHLRAGLELAYQDLAARPGRAADSLGVTTLSAVGRFVGGGAALRPFALLGAGAYRSAGGWDAGFEIGLGLEVPVSDRLALTAGTTAHWTAAHGARPDRSWIDGHLGFTIGLP
jgi:photosystem II stability/assembly factor-like uncharacterized protein